MRKKLVLVLMLQPQCCSRLWIIADAQTKPRLRRGVLEELQTRLVPVGTNLKVRLEDTLSSKESRAGDTFNATVIDPARFNEARVRGHISFDPEVGKNQGSHFDEPRV